MLSRADEHLAAAAAVEFSRRGFKGVELDDVVRTAGVDRDEFYARFPFKKTLMFWLIDKIAEAHENAVPQRFEGVQDPGEHFVRFVVSSLDFVARRPAMAQVIVNNLLGTDPEFKSRTYEAYQSMFEPIVKDLVDLGILHEKSFKVVSEVSTSLISIIYTGGDPQLQMEYLSFVYPDKVGLSVLEGFRRKYGAQAGMD